MKKYKCSVCGYVYDEAQGIPSHGISPGTAWEDLPEDWACPLCGASKDAFKPEGEVPSAKKPVSPGAAPATVKELTPLEISAICSNLARGCEKQYKTTEAELFRQLADYYKGAASPEETPGFDALAALVEKDLESGFPSAHEISAQAKDRGALRALTWSEKVTNIHKSLLARYKKDGGAYMAGTGVYLCTICGFIFVGDAPPELCPVCKVPAWKFEKVEGR